MIDKNDLTASNMLSFSRVLLAAPMIFLLVNEYNVAAVLTGVVAVITDLLDGYMARRNEQVTDLGKIMDPFADKVFVGATVIVLLFTGKLPVWFVSVVVGRDLLILLAGLYAKNKVKIVIMSNYIGKATVLIMAFTIMFAILEWEELLFYGMIASTAGVAVSSASYLAGFIKALKNTGK